MKATSEAVSTDNPIAVTFDTLTAAKELKATGIDERQAEAIVATISEAMSKTVATKADLELQTAVTKADIEALRVATSADIAVLRADMDSFKTELRADMDSFKRELRADVKLLEQSMETMQDKIVIKIGALMVTMTFLLLAIGPFYLRWVTSLMNAG